MNCETTRRQLSEAVERTPSLRRHLDRCEPCQQFERRYDELRGALRRRHAEALPDQHFAQRVGARLRQQPQGELLGWAAMRLFPAMLALALLLGWFAWQAGSLETTLTNESAVVSTDDPIEWLLADEGTTLR